MTEAATRLMALASAANEAVIAYRKSRVDPQSIRDTYYADRLAVAVDRLTSAVVEAENAAWLGGDKDA